MKPEQKKILVIGGLIVVIVIATFLFINRGKTQKTETKEALPTEMVIPTVDSSVKVDLKASGTSKEVTLSISGIPSQTQSIDYELSYNTAAQGLQGVIGTIVLEGGESNYEKKITLGTCSSGTCTYHQVVGKIKLSLKFSGNYGEKVFEKDYEI